MKHHRIIILLALIFIGAIKNAQAVTAEGAGARSCADFTQDYSKDASAIEEMYFSWAQGFMTGINVSQLNDDENVFAPMSFDQQRAYIRAFCKTNSTKTYGQAVIELYRALHQKRNVDK